MLRLFQCIALSISFAANASLAEGQPQFKLATFSADVTIPIGHPCMGGGISPAREIVDPLLAKGVVLLGPEHPVVIVAVDWCEIRNDAYDRWRTVLAEAAGTTPRHVMLASVHQHDAPVCDLTAQKMLDAVGLKNALCDPAFHEEAVQRVAAALRESLHSPTIVTHFGIGQAEVEQVASNRRVVFPDGGIAWARTSATADPTLRALPEGLIDPMLKTLSFWNGDQPVAAISAYSVHPMSYYGQGGVSWDFPGIARERRQADDPLVLQIYFSGCSGDTVAGKYNDGAHENRPILADRLYSGMVRAWEATVRYPLVETSYRVRPLYLEPRYTIPELRSRLNNSSLGVFQRNLAAMGLSWYQRIIVGQPVDVPVLDLGRAQLVLLPGESFVRYQLIAQETRPDSFVLTVGFAECAPGYVSTEQDFAEGWSDGWCWILPGAEPRMRGSITEALTGIGLTPVGLNAWLSFDGDPSAGPATDRLQADGAQDAVVYPTAAITATAPIFGPQSLHVPTASQAFNGLQFENLSGDLGTGVTFAVHVRGVPPGRRKLFSNYNGAYANAGVEWVFDSAGQQADGQAMWFLIVDPGSATWYEWDISQGAFDISHDDAVHHLAATFDRSTVKLYLDGTELPGSWHEGAAPPFRRFDLKSNPLRFGEDNPPANQSDAPFMGDADDLLILSRSLTASEIQILARDGAAACMDMVGACCLPGSCIDGIRQIDCLTQSGAFHGKDSLCADVSCERPAGACCFVSGACSDLSMEQCQEQWGVWEPGAVCADHPCPPAGACCFLDGTCTEMTESLCAVQGGTWSAVATCDQSPCPPGGACCFANGACSEMTERVCGDQYGRWSGAATTCAATACEGFAPRIWLDFEGDPATGPATDKLIDDGSQNATVYAHPDSVGSLVDATSPLFGLQSLNATNPRTNVNVFNGVEFPGVRYMGTQATLAVHMRNVPAGRRKLFSSYDGTYMTPLIEWVFDSAGQQADGVAMWLVVSDPATGNPFYEFDVPRGTFNFSQDANVHHIAMTYDRGDLKLYLDGNPLPGGWAPPYGPPPVDMALDFTRSLRFGEDQAPTDMRNTPFRGYADDLLILPQALDDLQIQSIARNGVKAWLEMQGQKYPDFNNDGYVNAADLEFFIGCATGAEIPLANPTGSCAAADLDSDGDVDMDDFGLFQACISGGSKAGVCCTRVPGGS